eukprot:COSAG01_NODE_48524_length_380_cov_1.451957_1_plen_100_part_10
MTNRRFRSMYALWTVLSFNLLLSGDFERLNSFVMSTWANDVAVGINQDHLGTHNSPPWPNWTLRHAMPAHAEHDRVNLDSQGSISIINPASYLPAGVPAQ